MPSNNLHLIISGPAGVGKSTIVKELLQRNPNMRRVITYTTRAPRPGEVDGVDYHFVSTEKFLKMTNNFVEHQVIHGNLYGTARQDIIDLLKDGYDIVTVTDIKGYKRFKEMYKNTACGCGIFIYPESIDDMVSRLINRRTETTEELITRLHTSLEEYAEAKNYDYAVMSENLSKNPDAVKNTVDIIEKIVEAHLWDIRRQKNILSSLVSDLKANIANIENRILEDTVPNAGAKTETPKET